MRTLFLDVAKNTGVSAYHLASRVKQEQGTNGTSPLISGTYSGYKGYYNFFNFNAYGKQSKIYTKMVYILLNNRDGILE